MNKIIVKISISLICCLFFHSSSIAQLKVFKDLPLHISYYGHEYVHPGIKLGTQLNLHEWNKEKKRSKKNIRKSLFLSPQIGSYTQFKNHTAVLLNIELGIQRKYPNGFYTAYSIGVGDLIQFNWGTTYTAQEDGSIDEKKWASRSYFLPSLNLEVGKEINSKIGIFGKFTGAAKTNYNTIILIPQAFWEVGLKISL